MHMTKLCVTKIKYIMHKVRDYNVIYDNAVSLVICEGGHFTHVCQTHE
jgi:hypothetical protein